MTHHTQCPRSVRIRQRTRSPRESEGYFCPGSIEFVGLPASGKTTLCRRTVALLEAEGFLTEPRRSATHGETRPAPLGLFGKSLTLLRFPRPFLLASSSIFASRRSWPHKVFALRSIGAVLTAYASHMTHSKSQPLLLHEGVAQRAFMLFVDPGQAISYGRVDAYARSVPIPEVIVHLKTSVDVAVTRQIAALEQPRRGGTQVSRLAVRSVPKLRATFDAADDMLAHVVEVIRDRSDGRTAVVSIEADEFATADRQWQAQAVPVVLERLNRYRTGSGDAHDE